MKRILVILLACLTMPAPAFEVVGNAITLNEREVQQCREEGGCVLASRGEIMKLIEDQSRKMAGSCGNRT